MADVWPGAGSPKESKDYLYTYQKLENPNDIRLVALLPGEHDHDIVIDISHVPLPAPMSSVSLHPERMSLEQVAATLPPGWAAFEAWDGQYIFWGDDGSAVERFTWTHPDPSFNHALYQNPKRANFEPSYEALSYTWRNAAGGKPETIYIWTGIHDQEQDTSTASTAQQFTKGSIPPRSYSCLQVGHNLASAMRHLRNRTEKRMLWIDALCINQSDTDERNAQVQRMCDIFKLAEKVVFWLGAETENSTRALQALEYLGKQSVSTLNDWKLMTPEATEPDWYLKKTNVVRAYPHETWTAINDLLCREWFYRQWIVQEIKLARGAVLCCGDTSIDWLYFRYAIRNLYQKESLPHSLSRPVLSVVNNLVQPESGAVPLSDLMFQLSKTRYSDPRDRVYGLLGLLTPAFRNKIRPDYKMTVGDVFRKTFLAHARHVQRLELLHHCHLTKSANLRDLFPSWVPDMSDSSLPPMMRYQFAAGFSRYHLPDTEATGNSERWSPPHSDGARTRTLVVLGLRCASVKSVSSKFPEQVDDLVCSVRNLASDELAANNTETYVTGEPFKVAFAKTLCGDRLRERFPGADESHSPSLTTWLQQNSAYALFGDGTRLGSSAVVDFVTSEESTLPWFEHTVLERLMNRRYVVTEEGYVGHGPPDIQPGDIICVLLGLCTPAVLRPRPQSSSSRHAEEFLYVGPIYVYGLHDVIGILGPLPKPWRVQVLQNESGFWGTYRFFNPDANELSDEDPRLPSLELEGIWERLDGIKRTADDPVVFQRFRNKLTGETISHDPRMEPDALRARGVDVRAFNLV
ncbi:hypothetical protein SMACR_05254 [Sordaria macrospora]|uniref:WGS project CABT00000000 data, contig 2.8 n=2 Tax=Sordaria macrospora TaxID=5147 RepID=F7VUY5_SORMK|nr:uncharacterized protein SMAC_05254 [Sordaria macrospora k-hell]KAA8632660.1 hypothetical protein SMACR_05254 [Sordaria macrospora]WPJ57367.1 hypothetical protein SMAC4_05254 [Sordaria macrospora]CCC09331.1 unnamed protein product [Sordaria macrospora k-hell]